MDLESLQIKPISEMSTDEAIELVRQLRLSRRTRASKPKSTTVTKRVASSAVMNKMTASQAAELLTMLKGN